MSARDKLYAYAGTPSVLPEHMLDAALDAYRAEVLAGIGQIYDGELLRHRGLIRVLRSHVLHDDFDAVKRALNEFAENDARAREKSSRPAADATPAALRAEDARDLTTLAPAIHADAQPCGDVIRLELAATRDQWTAWQKALAVDLHRTTNRGNGLVTSHADWRGLHVVIACQLAEGGEDR